MEKSYWKEWLKAAGIRAARTAAQAALAIIGTSTATFAEVNWLFVLEGTLMAAIISMLMALKGLPELKAVKPETETATSSVIETEQGAVDIDDSWAIEDYSDSNAAGGEDDGRDS